MLINSPFIIFPTFSTAIRSFSWKTELEGISSLFLLIPSVKLCCPLDLYLFSLPSFSSYTYHSEFFFQKLLPLKIFSSVGNFSEVLLTSFVRLLLYSVFWSLIIRFSFPVFSSSFYFFIRLLLFSRFSSNFLSLTFFLLFFDSDVYYTCFLFYSRRSNLTVLWSVPPFLKLWGNSLSFCWSVPLFLNFHLTSIWNIYLYIV